MRLELHPEARAELRRAALWYDERRSGLGDELVAEVSAAPRRSGLGRAGYMRSGGPAPRRACHTASTLTSSPQGT